MQALAFPTCSSILLDGQFANNAKTEIARESVQLLTGKKRDLAI